MSPGYEYDPEYGGGNYNPDNCGDISNPLDGCKDPLSNEFTNNEIRDSFVTGDKCNKNGTENSGVDLNDCADTTFNSSATGKTSDEIGEDWNKVDTEQLEAALDNFLQDKWSDLSLEEQKRSMTDLANYVADETGNKNPPGIIFRNDMKEGEYGGYNPVTNTLEINENMLDNSAEAADTVAHEMWHAYQQQCALDPTNERGREYQDGFNNYINPEYDFEGYQNQMVEAEAREFAQGFKDRLAGMSGGAKA